MISLAALYWMQGGLCFYCARETWLANVEQKAAAKTRLGLRTTNDLRNRQANREHLHRRADGGGNGFDNIVMACVECNSGRKTTPVLLHLSDRRNRFALVDSEPSADDYRERGDYEPMVRTPPSTPSPRREVPQHAGTAADRDQDADREHVAEHDILV